jgi:DNA-binding transcriptional MerR regulator
MSDARYDIKALCAEAAVTPRTVHFYIQAGLLRPAGMTGPGAKYDDSHLTRLRLIKLLQKDHLPLAEIRKRLESLNDEEAETILGEYDAQNATPRFSAVNYIRSVLAGSRTHNLPASARAAEMSKPSDLPQHRRSIDRSQWDRMTITTDIELHVRRPLSREQNRQLERLILYARELFEEKEPS